MYVLDASATTWGADGAMDQQNCCSVKPAISQLQQLQDEISAFDSKILTKPSVIVLNKSDCLTQRADEFASNFTDMMSHHGLTFPVILTSALTSQGIPSLANMLKNICQDMHGSRHVLAGNELPQ